MINSTLIKKLAPKYEVDKYGDKRSYNSFGQLHSFDDHPALISVSGSKFWFKEGKRHRDNNLPAEIWYDGYAEWWVDGKRIRSEFV
jgi:hypothetical protein